MKIAVYGSASGELDPEILEKARIIGEQIASSGNILVTGACPGYPYEAVKGAMGQGGTVIGFSPFLNKAEHMSSGYPVKGFTRIIYLPEDYKHAKEKHVCTKYRNISSVAFSDACILIAGRTGTLNEFTIAYDLSKIIGVLQGSGGAADMVKELVNRFKKETGSKIFYSKDPKQLVAEIARYK